MDAGNIDVVLVGRPASRRRRPQGGGWADGRRAPEGVADRFAELASKVRGGGQRRLAAERQHPEERLANIACRDPARRTRLVLTRGQPGDELAGLDPPADIGRQGDERPGPNPGGHLADLGHATSQIAGHGSARGQVVARSASSRPTIG